MHILLYRCSCCYKCVSYYRCSCCYKCISYSTDVPVVISAYLTTDVPVVISVYLTTDVPVVISAYLIADVPDETSKGPGEESGPILTMPTSDRSQRNEDQSDIIYYIQSDLKQETEKWFKVIDDASKVCSSTINAMLAHYCHWR